MKRILIFSALMFFSLSGPAPAFVLPPSFVLKTWSDDLGKAKTIRVHQVTTFWDGNSPQGTPVSEEIWMKRTGLFRKNASTAIGQTDHIFTSARAGKITSGRFETLTPFDVFGPVGIFYLFADRSRMNATMRQLGVDLSKSQLAINGRQVLIEIGDPRAARIQFSKDDNIPAGAEIMGKTYKFDFSNSSRFPLRYPSVIEVSVAGKLLERTEVSRVEMNIAIPDSIIEKPLLQTPPGKK